MGAESRAALWKTTFVDVFQIHKQCGCNVGYRGHNFNHEDVFYQTRQSGATWELRGQQEYILHHNRLFFTDTSKGWLVGDGGIILHTTNGGVSFVEEEQIDKIPNSVLLSQNYPNPYNPSTKIQYSVPQSSQVVIKVFDVLGNEIETLVNEEKPVGTYELNWNAASAAGGLPSGVYFYHFRQETSVKKMLLLK